LPTTEFATDGQRKSRLGLEEQREAVRRITARLANVPRCLIGIEAGMATHYVAPGRATSSVAFSRASCTAASRSNWSVVKGFAVDASLIKADANRQKGIEGDKGLPPDAAGRAIDEYLSVLDDAALGAATEVTPKFVSRSDPAALDGRARRPSLLRLLDELPDRRRERDHR
jgi:hypothetical protein